MHNRAKPSGAVALVISAVGCICVCVNAHTGRPGARPSSSACSAQKTRASRAMEAADVPNEIVCAMPPMLISAW